MDYRHAQRLRAKVTDQNPVEEAFWEFLLAPDSDQLRSAMLGALTAEQTKVALPILLADGKNATLKSVATTLGISKPAVEQRRDGAIKNMLRVFAYNYGQQLPLDTFLDSPVIVLGLSRETLGRLDRVRIRSVRELTQCSADDLLEIKHFGPDKLEEVQERLAERGLALQGERPKKIAEG